MELKARGPYDKVEKVHPVVDPNDDPAGAHQHFKEECDINNIMARYQETGVVDHVVKYGARYGETDGPTFTEAMQIVANAQSMFEELPSSAREHFDNDPARFLDYAKNITEETDRQELHDLGILSEDAHAAWQAQILQDELDGKMAQEAPQGGSEQGSEGAE